MGNEIVDSNDPEYYNTDPVERTINEMLALKSDVYTFERKELGREWIECNGYYDQLEHTKDYIIAQQCKRIILLQRAVKELELEKKELNNAKSS